jgi:streptogramin lyase
MRAPRVTTLIIKLLLALLIVLLIGFIPLRELLYPHTADEIAQPPNPIVVMTTAPPIRTPLSPLDTPAPTPLGPLVEQVDAIWVANRADGVLLRIDPRDNQITGRLTLEGKLGLVTAGEGGIWVAVTAEREQSRIIHLDPQDLSVIAVIPIYSGKISSLQAGAGAVWAGIEPSLIDEMQGGSLLRIDPSTNEINAIVPRPGTSLEIAAYAHTIWLLEQQDGETTIARLDTSSLQVINAPAMITAAGDPPTFRQLALGAAGIWATATGEDSSFLYPIHPTTGDVLAAIELLPAADGHPTALVVSSDAVLVSFSNGALLHVDPVLHEITSRIDFTPGLANIHLRQGAIWIENVTEAEVYRIDAVTGKVTIVLSIGAKPAPTPVPTATLEPGMEPECDARYPSRLAKGGKAYVNEDPPLPNRVRIEPDSNAEVIGQIEPGEIVNLVDGPLCKDGWVWWYIQSRKSGLTGWTSEGDRIEYWLAPID